MNRITPHTWLRSAFVALFVVLLAACGGDTNNPTPGDPDPNPDPPTGETSFVSADGFAGQEAGDNTEEDSGMGAEPGADRDGGDERSVEEGDIYRVLGDGLLLNLNSYRGVQVIDIDDVTNPQILGRLQISGSPVEMYVVDDIAYVLMNNWYGYYGSRGDVHVDTQQGGLILAVDISDPSNPTALSRAFVPGNIMTSRLTREGDNAALYAVASGYAEWETADGAYEWESRTYVRSFDVTGGELEQRSELNLGGYVADIQATPEALIVARHDWNDNQNRTRVSLVDISNVDGSMVEGDEVQVAGYVSNQFNLDLYNGVLRVVSGDRWSGNTNHLQTFDASDIQNLTELDHVTFGDGQDLYATIFLGNEAFFVTYRRVDPFHAFEIRDDGTAIEHNEFVVSGWNDFFRDVMDESRLIGIGINDEDGRQLAVSLYDITDLGNPNPLIERAEVEMEWGWSEANWDHRAFSVVEDVVDIEAADGTIETGLVLLPFSGWDEDAGRYISAVQIYTFSDSTLTRRGVMEHGTPVRRSFLTDDETTANLGEAELSLYDTADPDDPVEMGRVDLAPNYTDLIAFGDVGARVHRYGDYWGYNNDEHRSPDLVEIVSLDGDPDRNEALASIEVPGGAQLYRSGDSLVTVQMVVTDYSDWPYDYETTIHVYDLSDPMAPELAGTLETDQLRPSGYGGGYYYGEPGLADDCFDCRGGGYYGYGNWDDGIFELDGALAFLVTHPQQELLGTEEVCSTYPERYERCDEMGDESSCTYIDGGITCRSLDGEEPYCTGGFYECGNGTDGDWSCEEIEDASGIEFREDCYDYERYRYWSSFSLEVLDLSGDEPALAESIAMPEDFEGVSAVASDTSVFITYKVPYDVEGDSRPYVRYYFEEVDLTAPGSPEVGDPVNVPGQLIAVEGDTIFTQDTVWGEEIVETAVARLEVFDGLAYLQGWHRFEDQQVHSVLLDGGGQLLVSHRLAWRVAYETDAEDEGQRLSILDTESMDVRSTTTVDSWATLSGATPDRALFQVPGGILLMNVENPVAPYGQAFFPVRGWPREFHLDDSRVMFAAGRYGVYSFDADTFNLLPPI